MSEDLIVTLEAKHFSLLGSTLIAEASTLGLAPGQFPYNISIDGKVLRFLRSEKNSDGEIQCVVYLGIGMDTTVARIFND